MNWLDGLIILALLASIVRGIELGLLRQCASAFGFFGGLFLGAWLGEHVFSLSPAQTLGLMVGSALGVLVTAEGIVGAIKERIETTRIEIADRTLGSVAACVALLVGIWFGASILSNAPYLAVQQQIRDSIAISKLTAVMPDAPSVLRTFEKLVAPNGFPLVFTDAEPEPRADVPLPDMGEFNTAIAKTKDSVVKIEGEGCGGIVEGSGFVADRGIVITNAHVVAGVKKPMVVDKNGKHRATVIGFDSDLDIAILRTIDLAGKPLGMLAGLTPDSTKAMVMGYPGGGSFKVDPAAIADSFDARGKNIYNEKTITREIYSMNATVISGNSGGPVINIDGTVIGVVFAKSIEHDNIGYALAMPQVLQELETAQSNAQTVGTGRCSE